MSLPRRTRPPPRDGNRQRRDPRAERNIHTEEAAPAEPAIRTRRDPRAERGPAAPAGENLRIDRARPLRLVEEITAPEHPTPANESRTIIINHPACWIMVVPDLTEGRLSTHDRDVFGAARRLADAHSGAVVAVVFSDNTELGSAGADRVIRFNGESFAPDRRVAAIRAAIHKLWPRHIVLPDNNRAGGDLGRRLAAWLGEMPATQVQTAKAEWITSRGDGGRTDFRRVPPRLLLIAPEAADPVFGTVHEARSIEPPCYEPPAGGVVDRGLLPVDPATVPLTEAELIVSAGNGVTDWTAFHTLSTALGATEGCSRPVCDAGALTRDRQIGASGTLVSARGYIALGISGAPQHLQGIADCEHVIAVNCDPHAEIMKRANLAIVADAQQVMPALTGLLSTETACDD